MLGRTHALSGAVVGAAVGLTATHLTAGPLAVGVVLTAGAAVLPDIDHPDATCARSFGLITWAFAWIVEHLSGGHRHGTHSVVGIAAFSAAAFAADTYRQVPAGKIALGLLLTLVIASALRALKIGGHWADLLAIGEAAAMLWSGYGVAGVPWAIAIGTATHIAGDMLTDEGVPLLWPLSRQHVRLLPEPLAFTTGTRPERWFVAPLLFAALAGLGVIAAEGAYLAAGGPVSLG
jgi:membrane-bound metal-dependent hydrolase YbcI (DUF457 family)